MLLLPCNTLVSSIEGWKICPKDNTYHYYRLGQSLCKRKISKGPYSNDQVVTILDCKRCTILLKKKPRG